MRDLHELTAAQALRERFELEAAFASTPSASGPQLEAVRTRCLGPGHNGGMVDRAEDKRIRLMDLMALTRDLNREEIEVCRLKYWTLATSEERLYNRRLSDIRDGDGEDIVSTTALDEKGQPLAGWVQVRGYRLAVAGNGAIADDMAARGHKNADGNPMSPGAVEKRHRAASEKTQWALQVLRAKMEMEERGS